MLKHPMIFFFFLLLLFLTQKCFLLFTSLKLDTDLVTKAGQASKSGIAAFGMFKEKQGQAQGSHSTRPCCSSACLTTDWLSNGEEVAHEKCHLLKTITGSFVFPFPLFNTDCCLNYELIHRSIVKNADYNYSLCSVQTHLTGSNLILDWC